MADLIQNPAQHNAKRGEYSLPPIPENAELFQNRYAYEKPETVHGWQWSSTFGTWSALVTFADGWHGFTYPRTW